MPCEDTDGVSVVDEYPLHAVAKLLGIEDEVQLTEALISNVNHIKGKENTLFRAMLIEDMDTFAKKTLSKIFQLLCQQGLFQK